MSTIPTRLDAVIREIDAANAADPRQDVIDGVTRPREVVYAERMSACLMQLYPNASETLQIAARAQHICRWQIPRGGYSLGREGYNAWRAACRAHHAALVSGIMARHCWSVEQMVQVADIVKKQRIKSDPDSQALENVVGVVFVRYHLAEFIAGHGEYDEAKLVSILRRTFHKMDGIGHAAVKRLEMPPATRRTIEQALKDG